LTGAILTDIEGTGACGAGRTPSWTSPAGHASMGIVGTVDSAYQALVAAIAGNDGAAMAAAA